MSELVLKPSEFEGLLDTPQMCSRLKVEEDPGPKVIALVGKGASLSDYLKEPIHHKIDETWGINATACYINCDRVFRMDSEAIEKDNPLFKAQGLDMGLTDEFIASKVGKTPIYVSGPRTGALSACNLQQFPIDDFIARFRKYFEDDPSKFIVNNAFAYMVGLAVMEGATIIRTYGMDFTYPTVQELGDGRETAGCWITIARKEGVKVVVNPTSMLLGGYKQMMPEPMVGRGVFYGYEEEPFFDA
jgi:hypothetical protein